MTNATEAAKLERAITGMPAATALRFLAEVLDPGSSPTRIRAVANLLGKVAAGLEEQQAAVRDGIPVDSDPDAVVTLREYAVRGTHPDGTTRLATYGDRLFTAVGDAQRLPDGELLQRDVVVGTWGPGPNLPAASTPW